MKLGWLLKLYFLEDRFVMIILKTFKFGLIKNNRTEFSGISIILGILFLELQINLSRIKGYTKEIKLDEAGRA